MANEKRLIDADEIYELFYKQVEYGATDLMDAFEDALEDAQTVDAVEVVRCKDCTCFETEGELADVFRQERHCYCTEMNTYMPESGFCSRGERKDNERKAN